MCSEIDQFSSFLKRNMSGSTNSPRNSPVQDSAENINSRPEFTNSETERGNNLSRADDHHRQEEFAEEITNHEEFESDSKAAGRELSEKQIIAEDDDGFKTPTSSDHRIPAITECPPAPGKSRPRLKRKASPSPDARRSLQFEASSAEVESIFRPIRNPDDGEEKKTKKARKEDEE